MADAITLPPALKFRQLTFHMDTPSRSGGRSVTGFEQVTFSTAGRWRASGSIRAHNESTILSFRALVAQLQGRAGTVLVPAPFGYRPRDLNGKALGPCSATSYDGGLLNFDLSGFAQSDFVHATLATPAAFGATQISVTLLNGDGPRPGHYFGIGDRLYLAHSVWQETEGAETKVRFWPPLRASATAGTTVILDRPLCLMRLADDASGELNLELGRLGEGALSFVEAF